MQKFFFLLKKIFRQKKNFAKKNCFLTNLLNFFCDFPSVLSKKKYIFGFSIENTTKRYGFIIFHNSSLCPLKAGMPWKRERSSEFRLYMSHLRNHEMIAFNARLTCTMRTSDWGESLNTSLKAVPGNKCIFESFIFF